MRAKKTEGLFAIVLALLAGVIAIFYCLFAVEYLLDKTLVNDEMVNAVLPLITALGLILYYFWLSRLDWNRQQKTIAFFQNSIRYFLSFIFLYYAFIKICGNMFSTSLATMDTPLYKLRGFELTWYFFGYSPVYNWCIILSQLLCGILLLFQRTALAACLIGFGMMLNITLINFTHHIQLKLFSVIYTVMLFYFIWLHRKRLAASIFHAKEVANDTLPAYLLQTISKTAFYCFYFLLITLIICGWKEWKMRAHFAGAPSIYGVWKMPEHHDPAFTKWDKLIFDKGDEGTIKKADGEEACFTYRVDETAYRIKLWGEPFTQDTLCYRYKRTGDSGLILYLSDTVKTGLKRAH